MMMDMRTTLELDDDLINVAKQLAERRGMTLGQVISELARNALEPQTPARLRNGVLLFVPKPGAKKPNSGLVNELRDEP